MLCACLAAFGERTGRMTGSLTKTVSRRVSGSSTYVSTCHTTAADVRGVLVCSLGCVEVFTMLVYFIVSVGAIS